ncbi:Choline dehydrogenase [Tenacibaculum sp. MAR_2009_124]|uniref:GMC oxidoreductase n=1 Tax=Tenacibaculum sp. MAR_2009_124 TaxID=1250059 RepID=UPI00089AAD71|nr:GMC family oxidoreductase [Tenacibaculum sp. MAR_2009_124]SEB36349.1 Choline dehydrogenase [Tenacibaculum sp. MAR_2009_124]
MNITKDVNSYDAIVVGSGISGGWAAKELCEKGLKTLVLERGRMVNHPTDYPTANLDPWDFPNAGKPTQEDIKRQEKQHRTGYTTRKYRSHFFVDDIEHPYNENKRFDWIRGYHVGGRSLMWGRQSYRLSDIDFEANAKEGVAVDWPIRYKDLAPWYDYVEEYIGVSGENLGLKQLPDGKLLKPMELNCVETHLKGSISENYEDRLLTIGRTAHITEGTKPGKGRVNCQYRNRCMRGCPFGAYFSSNSSTLPAAEETGNLTIRPNSIVYEIVYDKDSKKATGVKIIDAETNKTIEYKAKVVFLCASAIASTYILLNSKSDRFPEGMGNDSGELGHNIMDHHFKAGAYGKFDGFNDKYYSGRRPNGVYIPRFRNLGGDTNQKSFLRGYGYQGGASREDWSGSIRELSYGKAFKEAIMQPGGWTMGLMGFGETLPYHENMMFLDYEKKDKWGLPTVTFDAEFKQNELNMRKDMIQQGMEMLERAGFKDIKPMDSIGAPGLGIHEMGTARMGRDPKTSVLNKYNQVHSVKNVFVTDGAAMTSSACQNPSLTYMAMTARAANYAVSELKKGNL